MSERDWKWIQQIEQANADIKAMQGEIKELLERLLNEPDEENKEILKDAIADLKGSIADRKKEKEGYWDLMAKQQPQEAVANTAEPFMEAVGELRIVGPGTTRRSLRVGRKAFDTFVCDSSQTQLSRMKSDTFNAQESLALVLMSGSGVGKTFAALTARSGQKRLNTDHELVTAYIGFNCDFLLTAKEEKQLKEGRVEDVIGRRLLGVLVALLATADGDLSNLDAKGCDVQKCVLDGEQWEALCDGCENMSEGLVKAKLEEKLMELKKLVRSEDAVLLVALDEAQLLDALVPTSGGKPIGARLALRYLRELQKKLSKKTGVLLLPLAMGIDPEVSLSTRTDGKNLVIQGIDDDSVLMSREDFRDLAYDVFEKAGKDASHKQWWGVYQALIYPRVRELVEAPDVYPVRVAFELGGADPNRLLCAAADKKYLPVKEIPLNLPRFHDALGTTAIPAIDFACFKRLVDGIKGCEGKLPLELIKLNDMTKSHTWQGFETFSFKMVALFLRLFFHDDECKLSEAATAILCAWAAPLSNMDLKFASLLENSQSRKHPFRSGRKRDNAIAMGLSAEAKVQIKKLEKRGDAVLLHCGGNAPIDFILLFCTGVATKEGRNVRTIEARYADAKQTQGTGACAASALGVVLEKVKKSAAVVHTGLRRVFAKNPEWQLVGGSPGDEHVLVISNRSCGEVIPGILNQDSFNWPPLSDIMFAIPSRDGSSTSTATGALLMSRPLRGHAAKISGLTPLANQRHSYTTGMLA